MPKFNTRPVKNKEGRFIIYPSFNPNILQPNSNQQKYVNPGLAYPISRKCLTLIIIIYISYFITEQVAQRRFSPSEAYAGTLYKVKHPEKFNGYQYPKPSM